MLLTLTWTGSAANAQYGEDGLRVTGTTTLERPSEKMVMKVDLLAQSTKDLSDALLRLKSRRAKAEKLLESLGVNKDSIKFGEPKIDESQDDRQRMMEMMMRQRMLQQGKKAAPQKQDKPVKVMVDLTAEWTLKPGDAGAQLIEARKLQDAVKAADLGGVSEKEQMTPEEEELAEEMEDSAPDFGGGNQHKPGEPRFIFTAQISAADYDKAVGEAFRKAKADAVRLAKATDIQLGALRSISASGAPSIDASDDYPNYYGRFGNSPQNQIGCTTDHETGMCTTGQSPGVLNFVVNVSAVFAIKE